MEDNLTTALCPVCYDTFDKDEIEMHVNKCIFLNTEMDHNETQQKRKRTTSLLNDAASTSNSTANDKYSPSKKTKSNNVSLARFVQQHSKSNSEVQEVNNFEPIDSFIDCLKESSDFLEESDCKENITRKLTFSVPLAIQVQPKNINEFFGQNHILGKESVLRKLLEKGEVPNMILWGPPGCGKTSLSSVIREICKINSKNLKFVSLCAATSGIKEVQNVITAGKGELKFGRKTILFMDEIHRFNKRQQDIFLLHVEKGDIILIGATTENPSFMINSALLSRCRVVVLEKLDIEALVNILKNAVRQFGIQIINVKDDPFIALKQKRFVHNMCNYCPHINNCYFSTAIDSEAITWLAEISDGDARIALGNLELVLQHKGIENTLITIEDIKEEIKV